MNLPCPSRFNDSQNATSAETTPWLCPRQLDLRSPDSLPNDYLFTLWQACDCTRNGCEPGPGGLSGGWGDRRRKHEQAGYLILAPGDEELMRGQSWDTFLLRVSDNRLSGWGLLWHKMTLSKRAV